MIVILSSSRLINHNAGPLRPRNLDPQESEGAKSLLSVYVRKEAIRRHSERKDGTTRPRKT